MTKQIQTVWNLCNSEGISLLDRFREPLLSYVKECMPDSDIELIEQEMLGVANSAIAQAQQEAVERERKKINSLIRKKLEYLQERSQEFWRLIKNGVEYHRANKNANDVAIMRLREVWREIEALSTKDKMTN